MVSRRPTVLHIEDVAYLGDAIKALIGRWPEFEYVGHAATGAEGLALSRRLSPEVVLLDLGLPDMDGFDVCRALGDQERPPRVLLCSVRRDEWALHRAGLRPVVGMISKSSDLIRELRAALDRIVHGSTYYSPDVRAAISTLRAAPDAFFKILSPREIELLPLLGYGLTDDEIAEHTGGREITVRSHRQHIMMKLDLHRTEELMRWCCRRGFCNLTDSAPAGGVGTLSSSVRSRQI